MSIEGLITYSRSGSNFPNMHAEATHVVADDLAIMLSFKGFSPQNHTLGGQQITVDHDA
jgi:hypothetical protein